MQVEKGGIYAPEAYARGKMLDHSSWNLPRGSPSDIDMFIDNSGRILLVELDSEYPEWRNISKGQQIGYSNMVKAGKGDIFAVCAQHKIPEPGVKINTVSDVMAWQLMYYKDGNINYKGVFSGEDWWRGAMKILNF